MTAADPDSTQVLILAPIGRDGQASAELLRRAGLSPMICADLAELVEGLETGAGAVFIAEEALFGKEIGALVAWVEHQPPWSDLPFVMLTSHQEQPAVAGWRERVVRSLRNVSLLERPVQAITFTSAVQAAVRARQRQYEVRAHLAERERAAHDLEALVAARTAELEDANRELRTQIAERARVEDSLRQAQKMEAVGQLTGGIAHDFNNLLTAVVGGLDIIRNRTTDERTKRLAQNALEAAERGAKLTGQLLAFSRTQRLTVGPVRINAAIQGMRDLLARSIGSVEVRTALDPHAGSALTDANQIELAVLNLVINARDAIGEGRGTVTVATSRLRVSEVGPAGIGPDLTPGDYVVVAVSDEGPGMPPEVMARAFDPFFTTKPVGQGTGLGLSQVYGIALQSGGAAKIESRPGQGTTVRIFLPRTAHEQASAGEASVPTGGRSSMARGTVLVVDDDPDVRRFVVDSLDALGYRVLEAPDGPSGLVILDRHSPDLLVLDFAMPGMNGAEVAEAARQRRPGQSILFVSGYAETAALERAAGDAAVLRKPFRVGELAAAIEEALAQAA